MIGWFHQFLGQKLYGYVTGNWGPEETYLTVLPKLPPYATGKSWNAHSGLGKSYIYTATEPKEEKPNILLYVGIGVGFIILIIVIMAMTGKR